MAITIDTLRPAWTDRLVPLASESLMSSDFQPLPSDIWPRFSQISTFMRLPHVQLAEIAAGGLDIGLFGVPFDLGTTNRTGPRHAPRQIREMSSLMRRAHRALGIYPFELARCADLGDAPVNPADLMDSLARIEGFAAEMIGKGILPLAAGGDHLVSLPLLRAAARERPVGMVHFDSHSDTWDSYFGGHKYTHGTPFRRAIEEGVLDPRRTIQIGIRGGLYALDDNDWAEQQGVRIITIEEYFEMGPDKAVAEARRVVGDGPTYLSFDIDGIDPAFAPGTGTPEIGGYTPAEAQKMLRGLLGLNLVGADVVEVSPPFDPSGNTALVAASLMFEILCLMAAGVGKR
jgi:guanidinopropionase